jgi:hypothetical protein
MSASSPPPFTPEGPGSVSGAPNVPAGFTDTFISRYIDIGELRLHAVIGGEGPPLLLVHGWSQTWYAWRRLAPALAEFHRHRHADRLRSGTWPSASSPPR